MSEKFPGYISRDEAERRRAQEAAQARNAEVQRKLDYSHETIEYLRKSLPLLIEHATDLALPTEINRGRFFKNICIERGWVVRRIHHTSTESSRSDFGEASQTVFALTESGIL